MKSSSPVKKILISFFSICLGSYLYFFFSQIVPKRPVDYFAVWGMYALISYVVLYAGLFFLLLRLLRILKRTSIIYLFFGVANGCAWIVSLVELLQNSSAVWWFIHCFWNAVAAVIILSDAAIAKDSR